MEDMVCRSVSSGTDYESSSASHAESTFVNGLDKMAFGRSVHEAKSDATDWHNIENADCKARAGVEHVAIS